MDQVRFIFFFFLPILTRGDHKHFTFNYFTLFQHINKQVVHTTHGVKFSFGTNKSRLHKILATMIKCRKSLFMKSDVNTNKIHWTTHVHAELWSGPVYTQVHVKICINSWMWQNNKNYLKHNATDKTGSESYFSMWNTSTKKYCSVLIECEWKLT